MVRRHHLFAAGLSVALLFGASPAFAQSGKGQAKGHQKQTAEKPGKGPKAKSGRVNGGGATPKAEFSVQAWAGQPKRGHFNYTSSDGKFKVRCTSTEFHPVVFIVPAPPTARVTAECWENTASKSRSAISLDATFVDKGETGDEVTITFTRPDMTTVTDEGPVTEGSVKVRY